VCLLGGYISGYIYNYITELFPSNVRGFAGGIFSFVGTLTTSFIPYVAVITDKLGVHFVCGFLPFALVAFLGSFIMPETMNKPLKN
jgi:MFS family permease